MTEIRTWKERVASLDKPTDFAEALAAKMEAAELRREIDRLNAEWMAKFEELRKDAERYQFLKSNAFRGEPDMGGNHHWMGIGRKIGRGSTLNEAIDAAMAKKEGA